MRVIEKLGARLKAQNMVSYGGNFEQFWVTRKQKERRKKMKKGKA